MARAMTPRQGELLEHALALAREVGLHGLTVRGLAARVGFTEAALYRHFPNKEALLLALVAQLSEQRLLGPIRALAADAERTPRERLVAVLHHHVATVLAVDGLPVLILAEAAASGEEALLGRFRGIVAELRGTYERLLAAARAAESEAARPRKKGASKGASARAAAARSRRAAAAAKRSEPGLGALALTAFGVAAAAALNHRVLPDAALERDVVERLPAFLVDRLLGPGGG
jgi:TetR/AcrR family transcriptional regulator